MKAYIQIFPLVFSASMFITSCEKNSPSPNNNNEMVPVSVEFDNIVGGQNLFLNTVNYSNAAGEQFNISLLQYFISNIKLRKTDGTCYTIEQDSSYFLIKESDAATRYARFKVPAGDYNQLQFVIGVDSLRSTMDISKRTGVLDPSGGMDDGMYWGWNSGYIFFKMEGISPAAPVDPTGQRKFRYHIGGFGGYSAPTINNIKTITIDLATSGIVQARKGRNANIHLMVDILKAFNGSTTLSIATNPMVMFSDFSKNIAANYTTMFYHDHTEN
ncbi:MAG TPA: MbnP family protein [Chitinophagaceae bacterium]|jgi:hypothetical protein|nr:MbnP family protein [Chitinophagaceae bacterium]